MEEHSTDNRKTEGRYLYWIPNKGVLYWQACRPPKPYGVGSIPTTFAKIVLIFLCQTVIIYFWQRKIMEINVLVDKVLSETGFTVTDKLKTRRVLTYSRLFRSLIENDHLHEVSVDLGLTDDIVEKICYRYLRPLFPEKTSATKWGNFLLGLINYKKCRTCTEYLHYNHYSFNKDTWDTKSYICQACKAVSRKTFTDNNPQYNKETYLAHKSEYIARAIQYRTKRILATPPWADTAKIKEIYSKCPEGYHVDHVVPLQGELVCGLHVESNLQYLTIKENLQKSNKFIVL